MKVKRVKRRPMEQEKIFVICANDKGLVYKLYKELQHV